MRRTKDETRQAPPSRWRVWGTSRGSLLCDLCGPCTCQRGNLGHGGISTVTGRDGLEDQR